MVYDRVLAQFRDRVRTRDYVVSIHADEEMNADGFTIFDVERAILTGTILEQQRDRDTQEHKYRLRGTAVSERDVELVAKLGATGKMVIITVYEP
ncbi:MAG TPA: DUF4258 domain-containing protein [Longimicrobiales bacterium]|nr:DUF4258 domain-containing protein [Longimicrobiales bacterium]